MMNENRRFGLIGYPIGHSMSPKLFTAAYHGALPYDLIEEQEFEKAWERFLCSYEAINVTAPFKELAFAKADILSEECKQIKATNLLVKTPRGIEAHNSDYLGVLGILQACGIGSGSTVVVAGFGGAGKAAVAAAKNTGADTICCNRSTSKAPGLRPLEELPLLCSVADVLIYTLPSKIEGLDNLRCPLVLEANYKDPQINAQALEADGCRYIHGREWLMQQAVTGYSIMTGEEPDEKAILSVFGK